MTRVYLTLLAVVGLSIHSPLLCSARSLARSSHPVPSVQYGDAEPLLRALGGAAAPEGFQGGLDFSYTVGPSSSAVVKMVVDNEEHVGPVWNVIGTVPGTLPERHDRPVVLGNHRDAWVFGAVGEYCCACVRACVCMCMCVWGGVGGLVGWHRRKDKKEVKGGS